MKKVLVIDDDHGIQEAVKAILEFGGYEVLITDKIDIIFTLKEEELPHLILLDLLLSGKDGGAITQKIKANKKIADIPVIMLSAHPDALKISQEVGADDFLAKPFDMNELLEKVKKHIE